MSFVDGEACDLRIEVQVAASFEGKIVVYGDPDETPLPKKFLIEPGNRLIVRTEDGTVAVDEPLCGNCVGIFDDKVSIVLPLACAPLFREAKSIEMAVKLGDKEDCRFKLDCETLRKGLAWASERKEALAALAADQKAASRPKGASSPPPVAKRSGSTTTASSCARSGAIATGCWPCGRAARATSPPITSWRRRSWRACRAKPAASDLRSLYARYILPAALAASLGLNALAYRLYRRMIDELAVEVAPKQKRRESRSRALSL